MTSPDGAPRQDRLPLFSVVLCAAGVGKRMGGISKPLAELRGRPVLYRCVDRLRAAAGCAEVVVVLHALEFESGDVPAALAAEFGIDKAVRGGQTRQASALAGIEAVDDGAQLVLIHDGARPLVSPSVVERVARDAMRFGAAVAAVRATETVKEVNDDGCTMRTVPRGRLWYARTPQGFRRDIIVRAHQAAAADGFVGTDDAQLVERLGLAVRFVEDRHDNLKITMPIDLAIAETILLRQESEGDS